PREESQGIKQPKRQSPGTTQRAQRNPTLWLEPDGTPSLTTRKTPARKPSKKLPPRSNTPGTFGDPSPPKHTTTTHLIPPVSSSALLARCFRVARALRFEWSYL